MAGRFVPAAAPSLLPWDDNMGPNLSDNATGIFWAAFTLFLATTASIMSGALLERIRISAFIILAIALGSGVWMVAAAWGWNPAGWLLTKLGLHNVGAAGCVHTVAGFFALGVLINLGPRIGRYAADGTPVDIHGHNMPLTLVGLMLIIVGSFGFLGGCIIYVTGDQWTNIYGQPATLSAFAFNTLMGFSGGIIGAYVLTKDPFWMLSAGLVGIISAAPALDVYYPPLAFCIGPASGIIAPLAADWLSRRGIDDTASAWAVHGVGGVWGLVAAGAVRDRLPQYERGAAGDLHRPADLSGRLHRVGPDLGACPVLAAEDRRHPACAGRRPAGRPRQGQGSNPCLSEVRLQRHCPRPGRVRRSNDHG
jgi:ammonia channel protein AmtB